MKNISKYREYFFFGEWHIHTNYTDGNNSVYEYAKLANEIGIPLLAFTEHVRINLDYDFNELLKEIDYVRTKFPHLIILSGVEAKVLPNGELDCPDSIINKVDYKLFAYHSFPSSVELFLSSLFSVVKKYQVNTWAHPGLFFKKKPYLRLDNEKMDQIFWLMKKNNIMLEINFRYNLPLMNWIERYSKINSKESFIFGADIHSIEDLYSSWEIKSKFKNLFKNKINNIDLILFKKWFDKNIR